MRSVCDSLVCAVLGAYNLQMHLSNATCQPSLVGVSFLSANVFSHPLSVLFCTKILFCLLIPVSTEPWSDARSQYVSDWSGCGQSPVHAGSVSIPVRGGMALCNVGRPQYQVSNVQSSI